MATGERQMTADPLADLALTVPTGETAAAWEKLVRDAGAELSRSHEEVPSHVREVIGRLAEALESVSQRELAHIDPYFLLSLQRGAIQTLRSLSEVDSLRQKSGVRIGLERMRQALRDVADEAPVSEDLSTKEIVAWLVEQLDSPQDKIAALLGTSTRTLQRWLSKAEPFEPHGDDAARVKLVAKVVNQLRHSLTSQGVVHWFDAPHPILKGKPPSALLGDPQEGRVVVLLAAAARVSGAT
jgi:uncharacterized protein (DUF2384 family)